MKTTSYEISKKLWEIGFRSKYLTEPEYDFNNKITELSGPTYDLETILEALPKKIDVCDLKIYWDWHGIYHFEYSWENYGTMGEVLCDIPITPQDESMADTAARVLIWLHEKGLVKFNNYDE